MRGAPRGTAGVIAVPLRDFGWDRAAMATLRHASLPWLDCVSSTPELTATPLTEVLPALGARDRLSLAGQFAAHRAFLQFAGISDAEFEARDWAVMRKRGCDCRLVRITARPATPEDDVPALAAVQQFAEIVKVPPLDVLRRSWARPETVFAEIYRRLRTDAAADLRWVQRSAFGEILEPGAEALRAIWRGQPSVCEVSDATAFLSHAALDESARCVVLGREFAIHRFSALHPLHPEAGPSDSPPVVAERVIERLAAERHVLIIGKNVDPASRAVLEIVAAANVAVLVTQADGAAAGAPRFMLMSTRVGASSAISDWLPRGKDGREWLEHFVTTGDFDRFLESGELPVGTCGFDGLEEPRRSFVAALALLGARIPRTLATDYLRQFLVEVPLEQVVVDGVTALDGDALVFVSEQIREHCARHIPEASKPALCRAAASVADRIRAGQLLVEVGEVAIGVELLEQSSWPSSLETVRTLASVPRSAFSPRLAAVFADALVREGRYEQARDVAPLLAEGDRELILARCDRRTGDYCAALSRLERLESPTWEAAVLQSELLRLTEAPNRAAEALARVTATTDEQQIRSAYERSLLDLDMGIVPQTAWAEQEHYFASRFQTYETLARGEFEEAEKHASRSASLARCAAERIDAALDRVYASFSSGRWNETRGIAVESLALIDEAQGDRAAAGILFTLAYLCADDGQWSAASQHIRRLRSYYAADQQHLEEVDLLSAQLELSRGNLDEARRLAERLIEQSPGTSQIREAAALIADEVDWIKGVRRTLRSRGGSHNRELDERFHAMRARSGEPSTVSDPFLRALLKWERAPDSTAPVAHSRSEKLKLMRSALACGRRALAAEIARETGASITETVPVGHAIDVQVLRLAAAADYPFRNDLFGVPWCFAVRNRLGQWSQEGPHAVDAALLDRVLSDPEPGWMSCSERELLYLDGSATWPEPSRAGIAAIFRTRAENHRLRRLIEQENASRPAAEEPVDGIIGDSPPMRAVFALIDRVARRDVPVCILGESGTGKELVGRAIHRGSPRRQKPFTAVNCAALPETLVESELFGHVRGAFTGADRDRAGLIETTDGGTLFLDEIGEMPVTAQAKLLRFLQDGEFRRVGDTVNRTADVRIVSATNRKLEAAVEEGRFREDLYYRVRGIDILLPRLRDRGADVILLAHHFLQQERARHRAGPQSLSAEAEALLAAYEWPGNVRELQNTIRAAHAIAADAREIDIDHLPERVRKVVPMKVVAGSYQDAVARFRRDLIEKSLAAAAGNQNRAAALLNISRQALAYQIRELGILVARTSSASRV